MNTVELIFKNISEIAGVDDIGLLILTDMAGEQQIAVPCNKKQLDSFRLRLSQACHQVDAARSDVASHEAFFRSPYGSGYQWGQRGTV